MRSLTFTLLSDGASDRALIPALQWLLQEHSSLDFQSQWADLRGRIPSLRGLAARIEAALALYPCDLLFVHRDGEGEPRETRVREIRESLPQSSAVTAVCVVPVRMQEAWLLFDEAAIRRAADNPRGRIPLEIPALRRLESLPDPKDILQSLLEEASGLASRRLRRFSSAPRTHRVAELIQDFSPLRQLSAFQALEGDLKAVLTERGWL